MTPGGRPEPWIMPRSDSQLGAGSTRVLLGRQGIFTADRELVGYELLFRAPGQIGLRVDLWSARQQDRATEHVIAAAFHVAGGQPLDRVGFVNFTRSYLVDHDWVGFSPPDGVIEVVESAFADEALRVRLSDLRAQGYQIAIDDFVGTTSQVALLEHADFVKIDVRDLVSQGPDLVARARSHGSTLVAERVETRAMLAWCVELGFDLFQGHGFEPAIIVDRGRVAA
ncbi:EAL and HDOD domain-containing protein [uncultured Demequina sp.]|uniref:EAL and HDOD domain-containing protein n=1 Tax=uncultured Demequina sp. TaxID=693499 RepID=UPI0025DE4836|nr:EAL domain-containing protein [uncultured Demequina sp.]